MTLGRSGVLVIPYNRFSRSVTNGKVRTMRGRFGRRDTGRRRASTSGGAFQLGRILMVALIAILLIALLVALLD
jgi:hypothetical protein